MLALIIVAALFWPARNADIGALADGDYDLRLRVHDPEAFLNLVAKSAELRGLLETGDHDEALALGLGLAGPNAARELRGALRGLLDGEGPLARATAKTAEVVVLATRSEAPPATGDGRLYGDEDRRQPFPFARFLVAIRLDGTVVARLAALFGQDFLLRRFVAPWAPRDWGLRARSGILTLADPETAFGPINGRTRGIPSLACAVTGNVLLCGLPDDVLTARRRLEAAPAAPRSETNPGLDLSGRPTIAADVGATARVLFGDLAVDTILAAFQPTSTVDIEVFPSGSEGECAWRVRLATSAALPGADAPDPGAPVDALARIAFGGGADDAFAKARARARSSADPDRDRRLRAEGGSASEASGEDAAARASDELWPLEGSTAARVIVLTAPAPIEIDATRRGAHRPIVAGGVAKAPRSDAAAFLRARLDGREIAKWLRLAKDSVVADRFRPTVRDLDRFATRDDLILAFAAEDREHGAAYAASVEIWATLFEKLAPRLEIVARRAAQGVVIEADQK